jgi:hypothetical protein
MACGKSLLSLAMLGLADEDVTRERAPDTERPQKARFFPALVLSPPIVVEKWTREATNTLPTSRPVVIRPLRTRAEVAAFRRFDPTFTGSRLSAIGCVERVINRIQDELRVWRVQCDRALRDGRTPSRKPCHIAVLSTSVAKLGPAWTPVYLLRVLREECDAEHGEHAEDPKADTLPRQVRDQERQSEGSASWSGQHQRVSKQVRAARDPATGEPLVVPCCPRCFQPLMDEARAERMERERQKHQQRGAKRGAGRRANDGTESDADGDEDALGAFLTEAELLGQRGTLGKRACAACGEPLWQVTPDATKWQATPPPLEGWRAVMPLPLPDRDHHPPCVREAHERRYPLADYLRKRHRGLFRSLIADEAHQFKGAGTAQGFAAASLVDACDPGGTTLFLTGTLFSGCARRY